MLTKPTSFAATHQRLDRETDKVCESLFSHRSQSSFGRAHSTLRGLQGAATQAKANYDASKWAVAELRRKVTLQRREVTSLTDAAVQCCLNRGLQVTEFKGLERRDVAAFYASVLEPVLRRVPGLGEAIAGALERSIRDHLAVRTALELALTQREAQERAWVEAVQRLSSGIGDAGAVLATQGVFLGTVLRVGRRARPSPHSADPDRAADKAA